jgi:ABC-type nitrate/sulfonate/bicarbonate transport system ATPase subunit
MSFPYELRETLVSIKDVTLKFGDTLVLKPTSVDVRNIVRPGMHQGQVIGVLGPSGIGKTQFSRILSGLNTPTTGSVTIQTNAGMVPVTAGSVGVVFQDYRLFKHRTVLGNLLVAMEHTELNRKEREERAMGFLKRFQIEDKADLYPAQLSGGQRQRVAIIQELISSEHFLVMDEPFTGLDPIMKDKVCDLINDVATLHENNTIFVVAHDIAALVAISDCLWLFGRERDEQGNPIPGATIKTTYNLIERGLAWQPNIQNTRAFADFVVEVKEQFKHL